MKILIVGPSWVGDMVMMHPLIQVLAKQFDDAVIDVLAPPWSKPVIARMPEVRRAIDLPIGHGQLLLGERRRIGKQLATEHYDQAIVLPNSLKSALIPWFANIPVRTGWRGEMRYGLLNDIRRLDEAKYPLMVERFVALGAPNESSLPDYNVPQLASSAGDVKASRQQHQLDSLAPILALCPGAEFGAAKKWPARHYASIAQAKIEQGWQVWIFGSTNDFETGQDVIAALPSELADSCINLAGKTSLAQAIDLLAAADVVISNDSGLMHVSAAVATPLVAVYGSSSPGFTPPMGEAVEIQRLGLACSPCFKRDCPLEHLNCLEQLEPQQIMAALDNLVPQTADIQRC